MVVCLEFFFCLHTIITYLLNWEKKCLSYLYDLSGCGICFRMLFQFQFNLSLPFRAELKGKIIKLDINCALL